MARVSGLGHFGLYVQDMPKMVEFYTNVLGMTLTDRDADARHVFLSAQPGSAHHQIAFTRSSDQKTQAGQISFHVETLQDLKALYTRVKDAGCRFDTIVNHGIAFGCYFFDPEGNRLEVYWATGIDYPQPYADPIDLESGDEQLLKRLDSMPPRESPSPHHYGADVGKRLPVGASKG